MERFIILGSGFSGDVVESTRGVDALALGESGLACVGGRTERRGRREEEGVRRGTERQEMEVQREKREGEKRESKARNNEPPPSDVSLEIVRRLGDRPAREGVLKGSQLFFLESSAAMPCV